MTKGICAGTYGADTAAEYETVRGKICTASVGDEVVGYVKKSQNGYTAFSVSTGWMIGDFQDYTAAFGAALATV